MIPSLGEFEMRAGEILLLMSNRDVPYSPSFVLPLSEISPAIRNVQDLLFLPGFHSPTLAILYTPSQTWAGRYGSARDTTCLEIRTFDLTTSGSYPLLTSVPNLPSDPLYMLACPSELRGVVVITTTGIVHIDQGGKVVGAGVNGWWGYTTNLKGDSASEERRISLEGSRAVFVSERDMLLVLANGDVHQVRFEMEGRTVGSIKVDEQSSTVPPPSSVIVAGDKAVFFGSAEGNSLLSKVDMVREILKVDGDAAKEETNGDMEVDYDEDLYGDSAAAEQGGTGKEVYTGPSKATLSSYDTLSGIGKIMDMEFGIAATDQGVSLGSAARPLTAC
jgi:cleavage and polyadenylation specificity factor subunit 1